MERPASSAVLILSCSLGTHSTRLEPRQRREACARVDGIERSSLRRETLRRASTVAQKDQIRHRTDVSGVKSTKARPDSKDAADTTGYARAVSEPAPDYASSRNVTPKRSAFGTPRSAGHINNATMQSFVLPDVSNLTELLGGTAEIRLIASRSAKKIPQDSPMARRNAARTGRTSPPSSGFRSQRTSR